jgi:hypothetical protein
MACAQAEPAAALLEGLAQSGSEACLVALRNCSPAQSPTAESRMARAPGRVAAHARTSARYDRGARSPCAPMQAHTFEARGAVGSAPGPAASSNAASCALSSALAPGSPGSRWHAAGPAASAARAHAGGASAPERPRRPAWLEEAAQRVSRGIRLRDDASPGSTPFRIS